MLLYFLLHCLIFPAFTKSMQVSLNSMKNAQHDFLTIHVLFWDVSDYS